MTTIIVPAMQSHVGPIAANVRPADRAELWAGFRATPVDCMRAGLRHHARTALIDGVPVCMFGVVPYSILQRQGVPWMVATSALDSLSASKDLLRHSRAEFATMRRGFTLLFNAVDDRNEAAKRWLRWLGFDLDEPFAHGPDGVSFRMFQWEARACMT